jgi:hypothetical protein
MLDACSRFIGVELPAQFTRRGGRKLSELDVCFALPCCHGADRPFHHRRRRPFPGYGEQVSCLSRYFPDGCDTLRCLNDLLSLSPVARLTTLPKSWSERNAASGGEELLRLRAYEKLQGLVQQGAVNRTVTGTTKKYKGVATRMILLRAEMKALRAACNRRALAKAAAGN